MVVILSYYIQYLYSTDIAGLTDYRTADRTQQIVGLDKVEKRHFKRREHILLRQSRGQNGYRLSASKDDSTGVEQITYTVLQYYDPVLQSHEAGTDYNKECTQNIRGSYLYL